MFGPLASGSKGDKTMKRTLFFITCLGLLLAFSPYNDVAAADPVLPACEVDGDMDQDGVADLLDSDETDSCLQSSTGLEDCITGAGDGYPDCQ